MISIKGTTLEQETELQTFTTEEKINLKDFIAEKIGYCAEFFYLGETENGKSVYQGYKLDDYKTVSLVWEDMISIKGASEDIVKTQKNLEKKLKINLILFHSSKYYRTKNETKSK